MALGVKVGLSSPNFSGDEWPQEQFAPLFLNLVCGGGVTFYLHSGILISLDTRVSLGLNPVMNSGETGLDQWKQNNIQLLAGFGRLITGRKSLRSRLR